MNELSERVNHAIRKHGDNTPLGPITDDRRVTILTEEVGETAKAVQDGDSEDIEYELYDVMAVCYMWLERLIRDSE